MLFHVKAFWQLKLIFFKKNQFVLHSISEFGDAVRKFIIFARQGFSVHSSPHKPSADLIPKTRWQASFYDRLQLQDANSNTSFETRACKLTLKKTCVIFDKPSVFLTSLETSFEVQCFPANGLTRSLYKRYILIGLKL